MKNEQKTPCQVYRFCRANPGQLEEMMESTESLHLTDAALCHRSLSLIKAFVAGGGELILDVDRLAAFMNKEAIDYDRVLRDQEALVMKLPVTDRIKVVAPLVEGDLKQTIALQHRYQAQLKRLAELGVTTILPMILDGQSAQELAHLHWFKTEIGPTIMGLKPGGNQKDLLHVLKGSGCKRIHLLNAMSRPARSLLDQLPEALSSVPQISGSFNPGRKAS